MLKNWAGKVPRFQWLIWRHMGEWGGRPNHKPVLGQTAAWGESHTTKIMSSIHSFWKDWRTVVSKFHFLNAKRQKLCLPTSPAPSPKTLLYSNYIWTQLQIYIHTCFNKTSLYFLQYLLWVKLRYNMQFYHHSTLICRSRLSEED